MRFAPRATWPMRRQGRDISGEGSSLRSRAAANRMVNPHPLAERLRQLTLDAERKSRLVTWVETTDRDFSR